MFVSENSSAKMTFISTSELRDITYLTAADVVVVYLLALSSTGFEAKMRGFRNTNVYSPPSIALHGLETIALAHRI